MFTIDLEDTLGTMVSNDEIRMGTMTLAISAAIVLDCLSGFSIEGVGIPD